MEFEWDPQKAAANLRKHGVVFTEAVGVFTDPLSITYHDPDHSGTENRYLTLGTSLSGRLLIVAHTNRGSRICIISARKTTRRERKQYEEEG